LVELAIFEAVFTEPTGERKCKLFEYAEHRIFWLDVVADWIAQRIDCILAVVKSIFKIEFFNREVEYSSLTKELRRYNGIV